MNNKKKCFVIMPFSETDSLVEEKWTEIFEHITKPAVEESGLGYECKRYGLGRANIVKDILEDLNRAQVVVADLTDNNPNVLWELGVRHTLKRRTILISQDKKFIPSDLKDYPVTSYDQTKPGFDRFKDEIKKKLENIEAEPDKSDSPVADFLQLKNIDIFAYDKSANLKKLDALLSELSFNMEKSDKILNQIKETQEKRKKGEKGTWATIIRLSNTGLQLLLTTRYILLPQKLLQAIDLSNREINLINTHLDLRPVLGERIEKTLTEVLPGTKEAFITLMELVSRISLEYASDNYQEPKEPIILLASPEHKKYLKLME